MQSVSENTTPLCVDLDGTLLLTDTLWESLFRMLKLAPLTLFLLPLWLLRGRAHLKAQIAARGVLDGNLLPYHQGLLSFLRQEHGLGRKLWLVTAADTSIANTIASHTGLFQRVIASDGKRNIKGPAKRDVLVQQAGERGFDYAGNDAADFPVWAAARRGVVVSSDRRIRTRAASLCEIERTEDRPAAGVIGYLKCLRVHQWAKNALLFVPLLTSHQFDDPALISAATIAFLAFSLCASSVYILNDLLDLPSDRKHGTKCNRPLASGLVPIPLALVIAAGSLVAGFAIALLVNIQFAAVLFAYYVITLLYSLVLKSIALVDVLILAGLYVVRVIGGAVAVEVDLSFWLLAFSMFIFLSLALVKRSAELIALKQQQTGKAEGRGYQLLDLEYLRSMGTSAGYLSVLVLALYINSPSVLVLYPSPEYLWLLCPLMLYWISYMWLRTGRGGMNEDPVLFAIKDPLSITIFASFAVVLVLATFLR